MQYAILEAVLYTYNVIDGWTCSNTEGKVQLAAIAIEGVHLDAICNLQFSMFNPGACKVLQCDRRLDMQGKYNWLQLQ